MEAADINCGEFADRLDDYIDDVLAAADAAALERHAAGCTACRQRVERETRLRELLQDYGESVVPLPDAAWFDRALAQAAADGARQQKNRWLMTALGGAIAAGVAMLVVGAMLFRTPAPLPPAAATATATVALEIAAPRTVNLVFTAATPLPDASMMLELPPGVEVVGFPGQRELRWRTGLERGRNLLPLTLVAGMPVDAELNATLEQDGADRSFRVRVTASQEHRQQEHTP